MTWLDEALEARLVQVMGELGAGGPAMMSEYGLLLFLLTEPQGGATQEEADRWERTCDHCGRYCPDEAEFFTGHAEFQHVTGTVAAITFGMCPECKALLDE